MNKFIDKLEQLEKQCQPKFGTFECSEYEGRDDAYVKVRTDVLALYAKAQKTLPTAIFGRVTSRLCRQE